MNTTATLQYDPHRHHADHLPRILENPENWPPYQLERSLYWQGRCGWNQSTTYCEGFHPWIMNPITTNSCSIAFS